MKSKIRNPQSAVRNQKVRNPHSTIRNKKNPQSAVRNQKIRNRKELARQVLEIEAESIRRLADRLDESFDRAVDLIVNCRGRIVTTGMGKSGIICKKIAATLSSTGTPALFL